MDRWTLSSGAFFLACTLPTVAVFVWILAAQPAPNSTPSLHAGMSQQMEAVTPGDAR